jgi:PAS domain S-box-containing protein
MGKKTAAKSTDHVQKIEHELQERLKELECLYNISSEIEAGRDLKEVFINSTEHLLVAFQFPNATVATIEFDGAQHNCAPFDESLIVNDISSELIVNGKNRGIVIVGYTSDVPFLELERKLVHEIALMLSNAIEQHEMQHEINNYINNLEDLVSIKTAELKKSKKRYEDLFDYAPDGIVISRKNGDILKANQTFYRMLKYPADGSVPLNFVTNNLYEDMARIRPMVFEHLESEGSLEGFELTLLDREGMPVPVIGSFIYIEIDGELCVEEIYKDIRLRKEMERKLIVQNENLESIVKSRTKDLQNQTKLLVDKNQELVEMTDQLESSSSKLRTLFNAITDTVVMIDDEFNIKMSNKSLNGTGNKCYQSVFDRNERCEQCPGALVFKDKRPVTQEKKYGDDFFLLSAYPILDHNNDVTGAIEISRKITREKNVEFQLLQTDKLASLGQLVSGVAHEINNPNTFIRGNITIIEEAMKDIFPILNEYHESHPDMKIARLKYDIFRDNIPILITDMAQGANRIKGIVEGLRKFAKRDDGMLEDSVDLNAVLETCLRLVSNQIKRTAKVSQDLDPRLPAFKGNCQKLEQVFINILINASQAIDKKPGEIHVSTHFDKDANEVIAKVQDNGAGMDERTKKQMFDPFFTTKRNKGGTGLGVSIAYGIVKEHQGRIQVRSRIGEGTTFAIHIPVSRKQS